MDWRVNETRRLLALLISCRGVQFENSNLCTDDCIRKARESVYFSARGLTKIQEAFCRRSNNVTYRDLLAEVQQESNAAEALEQQANAEEAQTDNQSGATRAPPATSRGSRSSFTEQPQPAGYSLTIEHVFKTYGPYAPAVSPFFQLLWQSHAQSAYAVGRNTIANVITQRAQGGGQLNPALHPAIRQVVPALGSTVSETVQALERIRQEGRVQNLILARREERMELESALIVASTMPGISPADLQGYRDRLLAFTRERPPVFPTLSAESEPPQAAQPAVTTSTADGRNIRARRTASPSRTIPPATSLHAQLQQLAERFDIVQCGGDGACTFKVLHVIEWSLGDNRRQLHSVCQDDDDIHTRNRVVTWMEANGDAVIFQLGGGQTVTQARVSDKPDMDSEQYFAWMRDPHTSGGDIEIAAFAAMYVTPMPHVHA
jgi:hypothetical protein